jgi:hypothetical protein
LVIQEVLVIQQEEEEGEVASAHPAHHKLLNALNNTQLMVGSQEQVAVLEEAHSQPRLFKTLGDRYLLDLRRDR